MKKKIGMILDTSTGYPGDIRVKKEIAALLEAGHEIGILAKTNAVHTSQKETLDNGVVIIRSSINIPNVIKKLYEHLTLVSNDWIKSIESFVSEYKPDVLHAHDLRIVPSTLIVGKKLNIPVIADLHENFPAAKAVYRIQYNWIKRLLLAIANNYYLLKHIERKSLLQCKKVIVVVDEAAVRISQRYNISEDKIIVVSNTEDEQTISENKIQQHIVEKYKSHWTVLYIGTVGPHRGIDAAIKAAAIAGPSIENFKLLIVGVSNTTHKNDMDTLIKKHCADNFVEIVGRVPEEDITSYIAASNVCLVPHNKGEHTNTTIPHKLFQYMLLKKPVVVSDCEPLKRVVESAKSGLVFKAGDAQDFANCLVKISEGGDSLEEKLGSSGYQAATNQFSWKKDKERLVNLYNSL